MFLTYVIKVDKREVLRLYFMHYKLQSNTCCIMISLVSTTALNLSGFAIMSLFFIHSMALLVVTSGLFIRPWIVSSTAVSVVICKIVQVRAQQEIYVVHEYVE